MEDDEGEAYRGLKLGLGLGRDYVPRPAAAAAARKKDKSLVRLDLSFTLFPNEEGSVVNAGGATGLKSSSSSVDREDEDCMNKKKNNGSPIVVSMSAADAAAASRVHGSRKKMRLTKEQSTLLEDNFKRHTNLTPAQKMALAEQLNLRPRQVEVWFQNRRARTKQKQTEVDCELLKKCCESLSDENRRLKKELQELRCSLTAARRSPPPPASPSPPYIQRQKAAAAAAALAMCPSCEQKTTQGGCGI